MNLLLLDSKYVDYYTYLDRVFDEIPQLRNYYWLISEIEYDYCTDDRLQEDPVIIAGNELNDILQKNKIQFIWGVFSGYTAPIKVLPGNIPYADGNKGFWINSPKPQAEGAEIEIVCFDSTLTLFININDSIAEKLRKLYPDILNLDEENKKRS